MYRLCLRGPTGRIANVRPYWASTALLLLSLVTLADARASELVPYVGCPGFTQGDPDEFPTSGEPVAVPFPKRIAEKMAIYASHEGTVLAPRGWECSAMRGTGTGTLFVVPPAGSPAALKGASVRLSDSPGDSYPASVTIAGYRTVFSQTESGRRSRGNGRTRADKARAVGSPISQGRSAVQERVLEFLTPPDQRGLGTTLRSEDSPSPLPTYGVLAIDMPAWELNAAGIVAVRLPPELLFLRRAILEHFERTFPR
jgi:hypothetical protein